MDVLKTLGFRLLAAALLLPLTLPAVAQKSEEAPPAAKKPKAVTLEFNKLGFNKDYVIVLTADDSLDAKPRLTKRLDLGDDWVVVYGYDDSEDRIVMKYSPRSGWMSRDGSVAFRSLVDDDEEFNGHTDLPTLLRSSQGWSLSRSVLHRHSGTPQQREELRKKESEARALSTRIRRADEEEKATFEEELTALLNDIFDLKQEIRATAIVSMEEELAKAKEEKRQREVNRATILERRMDELLGRHSIFDW